MSSCSASCHTLGGGALGCWAAIIVLPSRVAIPDHLLVLPVAERLVTQCGVLRTQLRSIAADFSAIVATVQQLTSAWPPCKSRSGV